MTDSLMTRVAKALVARLPEPRKEKRFRGLQYSVSSFTRDADALDGSTLWHLVVDVVNVSNRPSRVPRVRAWFADVHEGDLRHHRGSLLSEEGIVLNPGLRARLLGEVHAVEGARLRTLTMRIERGEDSEHILRLPLDDN